MRDYQLTADYVLYELPSVQGRAFWAWSRKNDGLMPAEMASDGYIAQEVERLRTKL